MIQQIPPGEAALQAVVKIPGKTADQKLFNQVTVTSQETGERLMGGLRFCHGKRRGGY